MKKTIQIVPVGLLVLGFVVSVTWAAPRPPMSPFPTREGSTPQGQLSQLLNPAGKFANLIAQKKKKKAKHNYRTLISTTVSGDQNNSDYTVTEDSGIGSTADYYRKIPVSGLKISNPFAHYLMVRTNEVEGLGEEAWGEFDNYLMTEGNLWVNYGWSSTYDGTTTYYDYATGDYRNFTYNGGTEKKARKNPAFKVYSFNNSGDESNADATTIPYSYAPSTTFYYRKVNIPNFSLANLADYRIFRKDSDQVNGQDSWIPLTYGYFVTDGGIYVNYGYKSNSSEFTNYYNGDYRVFIYSNGKKKKKKLTKQYVKRYSFNAAGGASNADKTLIYSDTDYSEKIYYKKFAIPSLKMTDYPNVRVLNRSVFDAGIGTETWSPSSFFITNGYIWVEYGYDASEEGSPYTYYNLGEGEYRVFLYK